MNLAGLGLSLFARHFLGDRKILQDARRRQRRHQSCRVELEQVQVGRCHFIAARMRGQKLAQVSHGDQCDRALTRVDQKRLVHAVQDQSVDNVLPCRRAVQRDGPRRTAERIVRAHEIRNGLVKFGKPVFEDAT